MATLDKKYLYKISRDGAFLGVLPNVTSDPIIPLDINSAGSQLEVTIASTADTSHDATSPIQTENSLSITDEFSADLLIERVPDLVGDANSNALIRNNNDIEVVEFSPTYPNGQTIFLGYISKWKASFGGSDNVVATCLSYGTELDQYIIEDVPTVGQSQTTHTSNLVGTPIGLINESDPGGWVRVIQDFTVGVGVTNLSSIELFVAAGDVASIGKSLIVRVFSDTALARLNTPSGDLGSVSVLMPSTTLAATVFTFATPITVTPGATYYVLVEVAEGLPGDTAGSANIGYVNSDVLAGGAGHYGTYGGTTVLWFSNPDLTVNPMDYYIRTYFTSGATSVPFTSQDPAAIVRSVMDAYISKGGLVTYTAGSIVDCGTSRSYTFSVNTTLEGIKKMKDLAPANYYWFVDPATSILYFNLASTTADYTFKYGIDVVALEVEATIERLKNIAYFTGGPTAGVNLFLKVTDTTSINQGDRVGVERLVDNRVTVSATGTAIAQSFLDENSAEQYLTNISIQDNPFDTAVLLPGKTIGFQGYGTFVDNLILQIVSMTKSPEGVNLRVGVLPRRASTTVEDIQRSLLEANTVANPSTPS